MGNTFFPTAVIIKEVTEYFGFGVASPEGQAQESTGPRIMVGLTDPSSVGREAPLGSILLRYQSGLVQVWLKTTAPDTGWTQLSGGGSGLSWLYVLDPSQPDQGNRYQTLASLYAAAAAAPYGPKMMVIVGDTTFSNGNYPLGGWILAGANGGNRPVVTIPTGNRLTGAPRIFQDLELQVTTENAWLAGSASEIELDNVLITKMAGSSSEPVILTSGTARSVLVLRNGSRLERDGGVSTPVCEWNGATNAYLVVENSSVQTESIATDGNPVTTTLAGNSDVGNQTAFLPNVLGTLATHVQDNPITITFADSPYDLELNFQTPSLIFVDTNGGDIDINLPGTSEPGCLGRRVMFQKVSSDTNSVTFMPPGGGTVNGAADVETMDTTNYPMKVVLPYGVVGDQWIVGNI